MHEHPLDQSAEIARYWCETPIPELTGGRSATESDILAKAMARFPTATVEEFRRACLIANELVEADRRQVFVEDQVNNPCDCGAPGEIAEIVSEHNPTPTGRRFCVTCDLIRAAKVPCIQCGGPMDGEDVRAGITLCEACDPDELGWRDDDETAS